MLTLSDVMGSGWFAADAANVKPGKAVVAISDGAVGFLGVLSARQRGAERIIGMGRHPSATVSAMRPLAGTVASRQPI